MTNKGAVKKDAELNRISNMMKDLVEAIERYLYETK
jgi:hypothetical protein